MKPPSSEITSGALILSGEIEKFLSSSWYRIDKEFRGSSFSFNWLMEMAVEFIASFRIVRSNELTVDLAAKHRTPDNASVLRILIVCVFLLFIVSEFIIEYRNEPCCNYSEHASRVVKTSTAASVASI